MSKDLSVRAKEIISQIQYITIASVSEEHVPHNTPVFSAYDEDHNFYWGTNKESQKAKNIKANSNVFLVIYNSTVPSGTGEGVYIRAKAHEITEPDEIKRAYDLLKSRHAPADFWEFGAIQDDGPIRLYKAIPEEIWMNDGDKKNGYYIDIRTKVHL